MDENPDSTTSDNEVEFEVYDNTLYDSMFNIENEHFDIKQEMREPMHIWSLSIEYRIYVLNNTYFPRAYNQSATDLYLLLKKHLPNEIFIPYYSLPHDIVAYPEYRNHSSQLIGDFSNSADPLGFIRERHRVLLTELYGPTKDIPTILRFPPKRSLIKFRRFSS